MVHLSDKQQWIGGWGAVAYISLQTLAGLSVLLGLFYLGYKKKEILDQDTNPLYVDDDIYWKNGWYSNPNDKRMWVQDWVCDINYTTNMASRGGKIFTFGILGVVAGTLIVMCAGTQVTRTIFALPTNFGKGILVTPTIHGNLLVGPTAADIEDKEGTNTTADGLAAIAEKAGQNVSGLPLKKVITSFAGLRAHEDGHDFVIEEANDAPGFIDCAGIESPGLTSAPAIGEMVAEILRKKLGLTENPHFQGRRKGILDPSKLSMEERNELIQKNPAYGNIICRCEMISEGEILDSIHRPLVARSLDGVKRRTRAGMGRCQSGFCSPRTMEILSRECGIPMEELTKSGGESRLIAGTNKDSF